MSLAVLTFDELQLSHLLAAEGMLATMLLFRFEGAWMPETQALMVSVECATSANHVVDSC